MGTVTVTSNDTLTLNDHVFNDLATDDVCVISFPEELINVKVGKNQNAIYASNAQGYRADAMVKVMRGSADDQFLAGIVSQSPQDFPATTLLNGTFVKRLGNGQGVVLSDTYTLSGGVVSKIPEGKENVSGDVTQAETVYTIKFAAAQRVIG